MAVQQTVPEIIQFPAHQVGLIESKRRLYEKLYRDLGHEIIGFIEDPDINEIMLNPDGSLWIDSVTDGMIRVSTLLTEKSIAIINGIAGLHDFVVNQDHPRLEAQLPIFKALKGERFTAQVPPIVDAPCFTIRKRSEVVYTFEDYIKTKRMSENQAQVLRELVWNRKNILICGGPGSGKTTVTNALIQEAVRIDEQQRFLILEDLPELQCRAPNTVAMLSTDVVSLTLLLKAAMRMRPDRILIGEVRGAEALDMLKAWNTGCPGGICTVHANGVEEAIQRLSDLAMEAGLEKPPIQLIQHTIDAVVSVGRQGNQKGFIQHIVSVGGYENEKFRFKTLG